MRAGLSTIQQTLTPEAASVLNQSIAEAARRSHSQTTPLHVAATLLAAPTGLFRQACVRSHPNSSHPLQCRALELCFSVALDRLPSSAPSNSNPSTSSSNQSGGGNASAPGSGVPALVLEQPPISNALMAALKRAQAHQRRGCPEQQQQPLLAVKVELEQLVISILDDPSVSRVMREASFSSPAVKATIQQSLVASTPSTAAAGTTTFSPSLSSASLDSRPAVNGHPVGPLGLIRPPLAASGAPLLPSNRNLYINPRLQQQQQQQQRSGGGNGFEQHRREEVKRVLDILLRAKKRNPVLVSDSEPEALVKEVLQRIERREVDEGPLRNVEVISLEKQLAPDRFQIPLKLQELGNSIDLRLKNRAGGDATAKGGVVLDLGDLKWLVESSGGGIGGTPGSVPIHQQQKVVLEAGRAAVAEMAKLLARFADGIGGGIWLIGTATCATYLRCQVYHPTMENDWDLQAVPIAAGAPLLGMLSRVGGKGILSSSVESLSVQKGLTPVGVATAITARRPSENTEPSRKTMCPACTEGYERELAVLVADELEKSSESKPEPRQPLPPWLQLANANAKPPASQLQTKEKEPKRKQRTEELLKRWAETCSRLHPAVHHTGGGHDKPITPLLPVPNMHNSNLILRQNFQAKLQPARNCSPLQASNQSSPATNASGRHASPPGSPVGTDLVLGRAKLPSPCEKSPQLIHRERLEDSSGCTQDGFSERNRDRVVGNVDLDSFKRLFKGLTEKVTWQPEAASLVAATVIQCKSGDSKRRGGGVRGDAWLLFMGPDRVGKKKMAMALSELVAGGSPVTVCFGHSGVDGDHAEPNASFRGKTALDRAAEAIRRNPFSVVVLEDIDRADMVVQGKLRRAMESGRLPDSHGREVALGSVIFVMITNTVPENLKSSMDTVMQCEEKLSSAANSGMQLELVAGEKPGKRRAEWTREDDDRITKLKKRTLGGPGLSLDLNLAAGCDEDATECSPNSSDLTVELEHNECGRLAIFNRLPKPSISELVGAVDEAVVFKPVDFGELRRKVSDALTRRFRSVVCDGRSLRVDEEALDRVVGGVWFGATPATGFEEWTEKVLVPGFQQLSGHAAADGSTVVRLLLVKGSVAAPATREWLPSKVTVTMDGL